jgi:hypothetical protein
MQAARSGTSRTNVLIIGVRKFKKPDRGIRAFVSFDFFSGCAQRCPFGLLTPRTFLQIFVDAGDG